MQAKSFVMGIVLAVGLLAGCGGTEFDPEAATAPVAGEGAEVHAQGCSDCGWLYRRCMSRASTNEAARECEESRALCEETFCYMVRQASVCSDTCDAKLNSCLRGGGVHMSICFDRHENCMQRCPVED